MSPAPPLAIGEGSLSPFPLFLPIFFLNKSVCSHHDELLISASIKTFQEFLKNRARISTLPGGVVPAGPRPSTSVGDVSLIRSAPNAIFNRLKEYFCPFVLSASPLGRSAPFHVPFLPRRLWSGTEN